MDCGTPGLPIPCHLSESAQVRHCCINDAVWPPHPLMPSSSSALDFPSTRDFSKLGGHGHAHFTEEETAAQVKPESESRAAQVWRSSTSYHSRATRCPVFSWCLSMSHKLQAWLSGIMGLNKGTAITWGEGQTNWLPSNNKGHWKQIGKPR